MAETFIGNHAGTLTKAQLHAALVASNSANVENLGANLFRVKDTLTFRGTVDVSNLTFVCDNNKSVRFQGTSAQKAKVIAGSVIKEKYIEPLTIIYGNSTGLGPHNYTVNSHGLFIHAEADIKQLHIQFNKNDTGYTGLSLATDEKVVIDELIVNNKNSVGRLYTNINLTHAESKINIHTLRGSTLRVPAGEVGFIGSGQGWFKGEGGGDSLKFLTPPGAIVSEFSPVFTNDGGFLELALFSISGGSEATFLDSFLDNPGSQIRVYPGGRDDVIRNVERTLTFNLTESDGTQINNFKVIAESDRTVTGNAGVTAGKTDLFNEEFNYSDTRRLRVWRGWNTTGTGTYKQTGNRIDDNVIELFIFNYEYNPTVVSVSGYQGKQDINANLVKDKLVTLTQDEASALTTVSKAAQAYCALQYHLFVNNRKIKENPTTYSNNDLDCKNLNVVFDANAPQITSITSSSITFKSNDFTSNIKTTGTVSLLNNAKVSGSISDASGDSNLHVTVPAGYEHDIDLHLTKNDAEAQTNLVATGESFRYQSQTMSGRTVWFRMTKKDGSYIIQSHVAPVGAGNYQISLVVTSENQALGEIRDNVRVMLTELNEARDHALAANMQTKKR